MPARFLSCKLPLAPQDQAYIHPLVVMASNPALSLHNAQSNVADAGGLPLSKVLRVTTQPQQRGVATLLDHGTLQQALWEPNAIRYRASTPSRAIQDRGQQDQVVGALWVQLKHLFPDRSQEHHPRLDTQLALVFEEVFFGSYAFATIDIICYTKEACDKVRHNLSAIEVEAPANGGRITYTMEHGTGPPPPNVMPVFAPFPRLEQKEGVAYLKALRDLAAPIGSLMGTVRVAVTMWWDVGEKEHERMALAYIKLSPSALGFTYSKLLDRRTSQFEWKRSSSPVEYHDRHLACYHQYARDYPRLCGAESRLPLPAQTQPDMTSINGVESESAGKKRKKVSN